MELSAIGLSFDVLTQKGQLVFVRNNGTDHHFKHQEILRARLRLFAEPIIEGLLVSGGSVTKSFTYVPPAKDIFPVMDAPSDSRVVKWIAAATADACGNAVVYWEDTVVPNWMGTGKTAEFRWQPTSELVSDLPIEDIADHLAWLRPLLTLIRRGVKYGLSSVKRRKRASYEEEWDWGPDVIE
jgi:hypothetical protein